MTSPLQQLEQKLQAHSKRIVDLEAKYAQLLEELKVVRALVAKLSPIAPPTGYESRFDRWPGAAR